MPEQHAKLSASGAERWLACPPSVRMEEGKQDSQSIYAAEGTLAHAVAELKLRKYFEKGIGPRTYAKKLETLKNEHLWNGESLWAPEMDRFTDDYFDYIKKIALGEKNEPYVAFEQRVDFSTWVPGGFGTADCIMISGSTMRVIDLKYGKGVPKSAENNPQLMLYALGAWSAYQLLYKIDSFILTIVQPRLDCISEWEVSATDLLAFGNDKVKPIALLAEKGEGDFNPGDHCRFCKAKALCKARAEEMVSLYSEVTRGKDELSNFEIGAFLKKGKLVASWVADLEEKALEECLEGNMVPGWKAVEGRSVRTWSNQDEALAAIINDGIDEALLYERKALTLSKIEKLIGKSDFKKYESYVIKPPGKPTLVSEDDKREAISNKVKASDIFSIIN